MNDIDPDTDIIRNTCEKLVGCKINISFIITLKNDDIYNGEIENCNIVGDCMENIIFPFLKKNVPTLEEGPKQSSPDFFNRNKKWELELKVFNQNPCFDISNFNSYIGQLQNNTEKKLYKTQYLIFKYIIKILNILLKIKILLLQILNYVIFGILYHILVNILFLYKIKKVCGIIFVLVILMI
jgi:hypothetical protein